MQEQSDPQIEAAIVEFYAAFDNRGTRVPAADAIARSFSHAATITRFAMGNAESWSLREFIDPRVKILTDGTLVDFHEWETEARTAVCGNIACRISKYHKAGTLHGAVYEGSGTKLIQLQRNLTGWVIASILWEDGHVPDSDGR